MHGSVIYIYAAVTVSFHSFITYHHRVRTTDYKRMETNTYKKIVPHPGKPRSWVWGNFGFYESNNEVDLTMAICKLCKKEYTHKGRNSQQFCTQLFVSVIMKKAVFFRRQVGFNYAFHVIS